MRLLVAAVVVTTACGGGEIIHNLRLSWRGVEGPIRPSPEVAASFATVPLTYGLRDLRPDPTVVGTLQNEGGYVVRTGDNIAQYCSQRFGELLNSAGARLNEQPIAVLETDLIEYRVDEAGLFNGLVRLRVVLRRAGGAEWSKVYEGTSKRWGRTHNPENFNEALSNAFAEAVQKLIRDPDFAYALMPAQQPPPFEPPPQVPGA
jgi:hypothetical protein